VITSCRSRPKIDREALPALRSSAWCTAAAASPKGRAIVVDTFRGRRGLDRRGELGDGLRSVVRGQPARQRRLDHRERVVDVGHRHALDLEQEGEHPGHVLDRRGVVTRGPPVAPAQVP